MHDTAPTGKLPESDDSNYSSSKDSGNSTNFSGSAEQKKSGGTGLDSASQNPDAAALLTDDALAKLDEIIELGSSKEVEEVAGVLGVALDGRLLVRTAACIRWV